MGLSVSEIHIDVTKWETKAHGTTAFPAASYEITFPRHKAVAHWHTEWELLYAPRGSIRLYAGSATYCLKEGMGAFINSGILHSTAPWEEGGDAMIRHLVFHPRLVGGSEGSIFWDKYVTPMLSDGNYPVSVLDPKEPWQSECIRHIREAWEAIAKDLPGSEILARNALSSCILQLHEHKPAAEGMATASSPGMQGRMKQMLDHIHTNYPRELQLEDIAAAGNMSTSTALRCFRSVLATTPLQYVNQCRMQAAARLLRETDWLISDIGERCGFSDTAYFTRQFHRFYGITPSKYRKQEGSPGI